MAYLEITGIVSPSGNSTFGAGVSLSIEKGRGLTILSTSGRISQIIADALIGNVDFEGEIYLNSRRIDPVPARNRRIRVLGDTPGCFPHLTVKQNLEIALRNREMSPGEAALKVERELTESLLAGFGDIKAGSLDEAGRTILAASRAVLAGCDLLIISNLPVPGKSHKEPNIWAPINIYDALIDLKNLLRRHQATWVNFLSDIACVHLLSDRVAIFSDDRLLQEGSLREILNAPLSMMIADLMAFPRMNYKKSRIERDGPFILLRAGRYGIKVSEYIKRHLISKEGEEVIMGIRPEDVGFRPYETGDPAVMNLARITGVDLIPGYQYVHIDMEGDEWVALTEIGRPIFTGQLVEVRPNPDRIFVFHPSTGNSLLD